MMIKCLIDALAGRMGELRDGGFWRNHREHYVCRNCSLGPNVPEDRALPVVLPLSALRTG